VANAAGLSALRLVPDCEAEVTLHMTWTGSNEAEAWPVGLDGNYRLSDYGDALRGISEEGNTLSLVLRTARESAMRVTFEGTRATQSSSSSGVKIEGQAR